MNIVYSCSRMLYPYLKPSITSLLEHNKVTKIYILAEDDTIPVDIPAPHKVINVSGQEYYPAGGPNMGTDNYFTYMSMIRACIPELIKANRVIMLDVDTIICDSLEPLWNIDLTDKWLAWCPENWGHWQPYNRMYYNFGVAVLNLQQMRKDKATQQIVERLNTKPYRFKEQDVLNEIAVPDLCRDIPVRYNECFCCGTTDNPAIVHFAGYADWYRNPSLFRSEYFRKYL